MHTCKDAIDLLLAYVEGELPEAQAKALEEHLSACSPCVDFVATYRRTPDLCKKALQKTMPKDLSDSLKAFLRKNLT